MKEEVFKCQAEMYSFALSFVSFYNSRQCKQQDVRVVKSVKGKLNFIFFQILYLGTVIGYLKGLGMQDAVNAKKRGKSIHTKYVLTYSTCCIV